MVVFIDEEVCVVDGVFGWYVEVGLWVGWGAGVGGGGLWREGWRGWGGGGGVGGGGEREEGGGYLLTNADCTDATVAAAASAGGMPRTEGGVGRRGAVWPTVGGWLASATEGAASDIAVISSGKESA